MTEPTYLLTDTQRKVIQDELDYYLTTDDEAFKVLQSLPTVSGEPVAWEARGGFGFMRFVTDEKYKKFSPSVQRCYAPYKCASCNNQLQANEKHSTEENFQHFLSYSCAVTDSVGRLRMAYFHGANENVPENILPYTSPQALKPIMAEDVTDEMVRELFNLGEVNTTTIHSKRTIATFINVFIKHRGEAK